MKKSNIYKKCDHIQRTEPSYDLDEGLYKEITTGFRLLPTFESTMYERVYTKHYSLKTNELLKCRWAQYKKNIESRVFAPFQFPEIKEQHFYNCAIRIKPGECICNMDHRMKMMAGPGVDCRGHLPIPQEAMMKRGVAVKTKKPKKPEKSKDLGPEKTKTVGTEKI